MKKFWALMLCVIIAGLTLLASGCQTVGTKKTGDASVSEASASTDSVSEKTPDHEHVFGEWTVTKEATCLEAGIAERVCTVCNEKEVDGSGYPPLGHEYENGVCIRCGQKKESEGLEYRENDSGYSCVGIGSCTDKEVFIPAEHEGKPVTVVGGETEQGLVFEGSSEIVSLTIPEGVKQYGELRGCDGLKTITLPKSLTVMYDIPKSVEKIYYQSSANNWMRAEHYGNMKALTEYGAELYCKGVLLTDLVIPNNGDSYLKGNAFYGCKQLKSVTLPEGVGVPTGAFYGCTGLTDLTINGPIGPCAFCNCTGLTDLTIGKGAFGIKPDAFDGCPLENITVAKDNPTYHVDGNCLIQTERKTLVRGFVNPVIPSDGSVTKIGSHAFTNRTDLKSIFIPSHVRKIETGAFDGCTGLESIEAGGNDLFTADGNCLFATWNDERRGDEARELILGCRNSVIPEDGSVRWIGYRAFSDCAALESIKIPDSVVSIGAFAFSGCTGLKTLTIPESVTTIDPLAFSGCTGLESVTIPATITELGTSVFDGCTNLKTICYNGDLAAYCKMEGDVSSPWSEGYDLYIDGTLMTDVVIPDSVSSVGVYAFAGCASITGVTIPDNGARIGWGAFSNCANLTTVKLPASLASCGHGAFEDCPKLEALQYGGTEEQWEMIDFSENPGEPFEQKPDVKVIYNS